MVLKRKKRFGDRRDAYWVRDVDGIHTIMGHLMNKRTDAEVFVDYKFDVTELMCFLEKRNGSEDPESKTKFMHCIIMAIAKTIDMRPDLNRYVSGRRMYQRHRISFAFVARKKFTDDGGESLIIAEAEDDWTLRKITDDIYAKVDKVRTGKDYGIDGMMNKLAKIPRHLLMFLAGIVKILDFYGKTPRAITDGDPNFATVLLSNLGSINGPSVYHHLNNYGTNSIVVTLGTVSKTPVVKEDRSIDIRDMVDVGITLDERIADGFYFARSLKIVQHLLSNPELLDRPLKESIDFEL